MIINAAASKYIQAFMAGLCIIFTVYIWLELSRDYSLLSDNPGDQGNAEATITESGDILVNSSVTDYAAIIERPLFYSDRRPYSANETVLETQQPLTPARNTRAGTDELMLSAVVITEDQRIALVQSGRNRKLQKLTEGEAIDGWTVTDIQSGEISLSKGDETKTLELIVKSSSAQQRPVPAKPPVQPARNPQSENRPRAPANNSQNNN